MTDFRRFQDFAGRLPPPPRDSFWVRTWEERGRAVRELLGETVPKGFVTSFSWKEFLLPGACALTFPPSSHNPTFLYMTLGPSQPLSEVDVSYPWEFAIRTESEAQWATDLLYQLLTQWLCEKGDIGVGYSISLFFFIDQSGVLGSTIADECDPFTPVGSIRHLYLWSDAYNYRFNVTTGDFSLLTLVAVTDDENQLADDTTPAHLMLFLRRMGVTQACDPFRRSVLLKPESGEEWTRIKHLSHDCALEQIQEMGSHVGLDD